MQTELRPKCIAVGYSATLKDMSHPAPFTAFPCCDIEVRAGMRSHVMLLYAKERGRGQSRVIDREKKEGKEGVGGL